MLSNNKDPKQKLTKEQKLELLKLKEEKETERRKKQEEDLEYQILEMKQSARLILIN